MKIISRTYAMSAVNYYTCIAIDTISTDRQFTTSHPRHNVWLRDTKFTLAVSHYRGSLSNVSFCLVFYTGIQSVIAESFHVIGSKNLIRHSYCQYDSIFAGTVFSKYVKLNFIRLSHYSLIIYIKKCEHRMVASVYH